MSNFGRKGVIGLALAAIHQEPPEEEPPGQTREQDKQAPSLWKQLEVQLDRISQQSERQRVIVALKDLLTGKCQLIGEQGFWGRITTPIYSPEGRPTGEREGEFADFDGIDDLINAVFAAKDKDRQEILTNLETK